MNYFSFVESYENSLFEPRRSINKKEFFLAPTVAVFESVKHAKELLGRFVDQFCIMVLTLEDQDYEQIGTNCWALSLSTITALPEGQQSLILSTMMKNIVHITSVNDERASLALELKNLKKQFEALNNDFLVITKKMESDSKKKLSQKDALIYASQKIGKTAGFEINLITEKTESTPFLLEMLGLSEFNPLVSGYPLSQANSIKFRDGIHNLKAGEVSQSFEMEINILSKGKTFQVDLAPIHREDGKVYVVRGSMKDISLLKELETENEKQKAIAVAASKLASLGEMAGGVAHEINNPIAIIFGLLYKLKHRFEANRLDEAEFYSIFDKVEKSVKRISYIVSGLRSFSRDGSKDQMVEKSISSILEDTLTFCEARLEGNGIKLDYSRLPKGLEVLCRPTEISQVFLNLINNANDAILELDEKWIRFDAEVCGRFVKISVTDSGRGIDPSIADKIINPFFTTKAFGKGTGLGLSISHGIAKRHGGGLSINSESDYTQFVLFLPFGSSENQIER